MRRKEKFAILFMTLPRVVYDRNLHDRCTDFGETAQYIMKAYQHHADVEVTIMDSSIPGSTMRSLYRKFTEGYDVIVLYTDITDAAMARKMCEVISYISPNTKTLIYGDSTLAIPQYFKRVPFHAAHLCGDQEAAIHSYIEFVRTGEEGVLKGVSVVHANGESKDYPTDIRIDPSEWVLPPIDKLPIEEYQKFSREFKDSTYACSVYVSKGCAQRCAYCLCGPREGYVDRRRSVKDTVEFLEAYQHRFDRFKLHSADLFADKTWVREFCHEMLRRNVKVKWKSTVCLNSLEPELLELCAEAGCYGLGFGIETFYQDRQRGFKVAVNEFENIMSKIKHIPIRYKGFVMLGLKDQQLIDVEYTLELLKKYNVKVRPSTFTPFYRLRDLPVEELERINLEDWNKKEFFHTGNNHLNEKTVYQIMDSCHF
ncbi:B12-binding domain-containing radical SAM protein [Paenibacillus wynnii]|uniref:Elp3/MiaA/NifB-like radical SAM core domain-containing protein n=1 Tax=Paenibacillus wynnii TaxID=268407 RepID=A0A098MDW5_9BACL|nr:radical SAM protein [Paenibacillus wynnii]KGE19752.1 hypothetical protein PWYN_10675 [Paenibacillus wynnii]